MKENRTKDSVLNTKPEEQISIHTLVTLPVSVYPLTSQTLQRMGTYATPLQISRPSPSTSKYDEDTCYEAVRLDEVIELPNFDLTTITI